MSTESTPAAGGESKPKTRRKRTSKKKAAAKGAANGTGANGATGPQQQDLAGGVPAGQQPGAQTPASLNNQAHDEEVLALFMKLRRLKQERQALNADITATRKNIYNKGHTRHALALVEKLHAFDDDQRMETDVSVLHLRRALSVPLQRDIFETTSPEAAAEATKH